MADHLSESEVRQRVAQYKERADLEERREQDVQTGNAVRTLANALVSHYTNNLGTDEITTLYRLCQISDRAKPSTKRKRVRDLDLPEAAKDEVIQYIDDSIGIVGGGLGQLPIPDEHESDAYALLHTLVTSNDQEELDGAIEEFAALGLPKVQAGVISPIFYFLHPSKYPVINSASKEGMKLAGGYNISSRLSDYTEEAEKFREFRDTFDVGENDGDLRDLDWFFYLLTNNELDAAEPSVWVEKTAIHGQWKQAGETEYSLGSAIISPQKDAGGNDQYRHLREAEVGDIVLHLLQDKYEIVGASVVSSELITDHEYPDYILERWEPQQQEEGGYLRRLNDYTEFDQPIQLAEDVFQNDRYTNRLREIRANSSNIFYTKNLALVQGGYLTNCPSSLVSVLSDASPEVTEYLEEHGHSPTPFGKEQADEYSSAAEATDDVWTRLEQSTIDLERFQQRLTTSVVTAWSRPLSKIAVQTDSEITQADAVLIEQIKSVFAENETWLSDTAEELGVGALYALDPPQVLYMALLREIQAEALAVSRVNVNHVKLKTIFNDEYSIAGDDSPRPTHPLLDILAEDTSNRAVHHFTAPPDFWLTTIRRRELAIEPDHEDIWNKVNPGDIALLHSRADPGNEELERQQNGFIAAAVVGDRFRKDDEQWWWDEVDRELTFPYMLSFSRLFVTGDPDQIDHTASILEQSLDEIQSDIEALTEHALDFTEVNDRCLDETGKELAAQGAYKTFQTDGDPEYDRPRIVLEELAPVLTEISAVDIHRDIRPTLSSEILEGLYFPGDQATQILQEIEAALRGGKHVILTGPPGTGKTEIAQQVVEYLVAGHPSLYSGAQTTTATADWSTFDTVGGYMPSESPDDEGSEELAFTPGTILNRLQARGRMVPINEPLVIDELNRADIDKAFGQLFTVLSGQAVTLPHTREGSEIEILPVDELQTSPRPNQFVIPESWRMFATMNTYDKTSLYEMSYAFMRRFAFVRVGVPDLAHLDGEELEALVGEYIAAWESDELELDLESGDLRWIGMVWKQTNTAVADRAIGPAIIRDLALYVNNHSSTQVRDKLTKGVIAYIFPQLEGVPKRKEIIEHIATVSAINADHLKMVAQDMLQVTFEDSSS